MLGEYMTVRWLKVWDLQILLCCTSTMMVAKSAQEKKLFGLHWTEVCVEGPKLLRYEFECHS